MENAVEEIKYKGYTVSVYQDIEPCCNPREDDNLGTMVILHSMYSLGDPNKLNARQLLRICESKDVVALPVFMLDHSGITISTTRFACPWDSGQVGFIYVTKAKLCEWYGYKRVSKKRAAWAKISLKAEVNTYDLFIRDEVYGYEVTDAEGDCVDSCWGFITEDTDSIIQQGKDYVNAITEGTA